MRMERELVALADGVARHPPIRLENQAADPAARVEHAAGRASYCLCYLDLLGWRESQLAVTVLEPPPPFP
jgi:hypothetical protein